MKYWLNEKKCWMNQNLTCTWILLTDTGANKASGWCDTYIFKGRTDSYHTSKSMNKLYISNNKIISIILTGQYLDKLNTGSRRDRHRCGQWDKC